MLPALAVARRCRRTSIASTLYRKVNLEEPVVLVVVLRNRLGPLQIVVLGVAPSFPESFLFNSNELHEELVVHDAIVPRGHYNVVGRALDIIANMLRPPHT